MKERGILFTGAMVRAVLEGRKTQTRRIIKLYKGNHVDIAGRVRHDPKQGWVQYAAGGEWSSFPKCPYGLPGSRLYVRESYYPAYKKTETDAGCIYKAAYGFRADLPADYAECKWKPSIHMPKWAARIWLEITAVHIQRIKEISENQARAEGITIESEWAAQIVHTREDVQEFQGPASLSFSDIWNSLNTKRGFGWDTNPWVWVISFKRLEGKWKRKKSKMQ